MSYCFEKGLSVKSITTYVAGINYYHKLHGFTDFNNVFVIRKLLEGCHRSRISRDNRAPLTKPVLLAVGNSLHSVCYDDYEVKLFYSLFILAYFGLFRVSELVAVGKYQFENALNFNDVSFVENKYVVIRLRHFKTNQRGKPVFLKLPRQSGSLCPVQSLTEFLSVRPRVQSQLFCHRDGSVVTRTQFSAVLSKAIKQSPFSAVMYKSHSFRIGRATDLASQGYPSEAIMKLGRWTSNCFSL